MNRISVDVFCAHIEDADFFRRYGNPVVIQSKGKPDVVCMAWEFYERIRTNYWILELEMPTEAKATLEKIAREKGMTLERYLKASFDAFVEFAKNNPSYMKGLIEEEKESDIKLGRIYPVFFGETEEEARNRALAFEENEERE